MTVRAIEVTDGRGDVIAGDWLPPAEAVHRQLRPQLSADYPAQMQRIFTQGARMVLAVVNAEVVGLAVYRLAENTFDGLHMYVDDLVTDTQQRSQGVGAFLMAWLTSRAKTADCRRLILDSGTQRGRAHQFYFREGMQIASFHFFKDLD